jgi:hypothetical protein
MACGVAVYDLTAVYGRALAIAVAPALRKQCDRELA